MKEPILVLTLLAAFLPGPARAQFLKKTDEKPAGKEMASSEGKLPDRSDLAEGGPTVVCDGKKPGGYRIDMKGKEILLQASCLKKHEESHIEDFVKTCPDGCKGQLDGTPHPLDAPRCPAFEKVEDWRSWRAESECKAYAVERACLGELFKSASGPNKEKMHDEIRPLVRHVKCRLSKYKCPDAEDWNWYVKNCKT